MTTPFHSFTAEYRRRVARVVHHPVTPEQLTAYVAAKAAYDVLCDYPGFWADDHGLDEPHGEVEVVYAETEDEWRDRVKGLPKSITIPVMNSRLDR